MSDGPFKNLKLAKRWKRFSEAVYNESFSHEEHCSMASDALLYDILTDSVRSLLVSLRNLVLTKQMIFDPATTVKNIFDEHPITPFTDKMKKEMLYRLYNGILPADAMKQAIFAAFSSHNDEAFGRIVGEWSAACDTGQLKKDIFHRAVDQAKAIFNSLPKHEISEAIFVSDNKVFKNAASRKKGVDDGPSL